MAITKEMIPIEFGGMYRSTRSPGNMHYLLLDHATVTGDINVWFLLMNATTGEFIVVSENSFIKDEKGVARFDLVDKDEYKKDRKKFTIINEMYTKQVSLRVTSFMELFNTLKKQTNELRMLADVKDFLKRMSVKITSCDEE